MTTPEPAPAYTDRTLPAPWAACEMCGSPVPALPDLDGSPRCPECAQRARLTAAANDHLAQLLAPVLSAWAHYYTAQGMTPRGLYFALEHWAGGWMHSDARREHLTALLARVMTEHTPPSFTPAPPDRVQLDARTLPQLLAAQLDHTQNPSDGAGQIDRRVSFRVRRPDGQTREAQHLSPGCDAVLILNADPSTGDALLYYTGIYGQTQPSEREALRVPAALLPQVRAALGYWGSAEGAQ